MKNLLVSKSNACPMSVRFASAVTAFPVQWLERIENAFVFREEIYRARINSTLHTHGRKRKGTLEMRKNTRDVQTSVTGPKEAS